MGTDQGKTSNVNALMLLSQILDCEPEQVGYTTFRPPYTPTTIGAYAGRNIGNLFSPFEQQQLTAGMKRQAQDLSM